MSDKKLFQLPAMTPGGGDLVYVARPDGSADGAVSFTALSPVLAGVLAPTFAPVSHTHAYADLTGKPTLGALAVKDTAAEADLTLADITTGNATTARHGFLKKLSNTATEYMDGSGNWSVPAGGGGGLSDGDKGDITVSGGGGTWMIDNDAVTYAKLQNVSATARILGRRSASAGDAEECTLSQVLDFIGSAAQGDILFRGASGWARLPAGTDGQVLRTLGSGADPVWEYPARRLIGEVVTAGSQTSVTFSSIPATYRDLEVVVRGRASAICSVFLRFNGDTGANYQFQFGRWYSSTSISVPQTAFASLAIATMPISTAHVGGGRATIFNYRDTNFVKSVIADSMRSDGTTSTTQLRDMIGGEWLSTSAINSVFVGCDTSANFINGSIVSLYGLM